MGMEEEDKTECRESKLRELRDEMKRMEQENAELFSSYGLTPTEVRDALSDKSRYPKATFDYIQSERQALETLLDRRIEALNGPIRRDTHPDTHIGGHWIFVR